MTDSPNPALPGPKKRKKAGCLILAFMGVALWLAIAWLLWHGSMNNRDGSQANVSEEQEAGEEGRFFEIIPGSDESSFVETDENQTDAQK